VNYLSILLLLTYLSTGVQAATGVILGHITDAENGETLPGANVVIKGTHIGATTDYDGNYRITNAPVGHQIIVISYIGYAEKELPVTVNPGSAVEGNATLQISAIMGEELVVTAQLQGQAAAINQQISSNTIVNVVSQEKIRELPDQNAAESVGRLSGVAVQRDAGEGTKVVVRGLSPKFSSITVNGERIPSTDEEDRSVDLSMISSDALAGIEVFKSLTPDRDGDAIGGTINLVTRRAPVGATSTVRFQTGYNDHEDDFGQFKGSFSLSNRFGPDQKFGALVTGNYQTANRASDNLDAGYTFVREAREGEDRAVIGVNNLNLVDRFETRNRLGASANLDYEVSSGNVSLNSFWSETRRKELRRRKRYRLGTARTEYDLLDRDIDTRLLSNALTGNHILGRLELDWRGSFSRSTRNIPGSQDATFRELAAFRADTEENEGVDAIPAGAKNRVDLTFFKDVFIDTQDVSDRNITGKLDLKFPFAFDNGLNGFLKVGGKVRLKDRDRDNTSWWTGSFGINSIGAANPDLFDLDREQRILLSNFLIPNSNVADPFLDGAFDFGPILDLNLINQWTDDFADKFMLNPVVDLDDYKAGEDIIAHYTMAQIHFGDRIMILPGIRMEQTRTDYQSIFGTPVSIGDNLFLGGVVDTSGSRTYTEWLPMFHVRYKATTWMDLRLATTRSLSRPNYFDLVPFERLDHRGTSVARGNPNLQHTIAWNYDAFLSIYGNRGLFTLGGFYKRLDDISFIRNTRIQDPNDWFGYSLTSPVNSEEETVVKGFEVELQTNLKTLPNPWDGVVLGLNYSHITSKTFFPFFELGPRSPNPPFRPIIIDGEREGRLPGQADNIFNASAGYEKGGFSLRYSLVYQGSALRTVGTREELDGFTDGFVRHDLAIQQKLNDRVSLFLNGNNLTNVSEGAFLGNRDFPTAEEFFGWTSDMGIRYKL
jgi:TonB-dependent receptor